MDRRSVIKGILTLPALSLLGGAKQAEAKVVESVETETGLKNTLVSVLVSVDVENLNACWPMNLQPILSLRPERKGTPDFVAGVKNVLESITKHPDIYTDVLVEVITKTGENWGVKEGLVQEGIAPGRNFQTRPFTQSRFDSASLFKGNWERISTVIGMVENRARSSQFEADMECLKSGEGRYQYLPIVDRNDISHLRVTLRYLHA